QMKDIAQTQNLNSGLNPLSGKLTSVHVLEGNNVTLSCSYSGSAYSFLWYRQYSRSKPEYLLLILESLGKVMKASPPNPHLSAKVHKKNSTVDLVFSSTALTDSAMYYCALSPTVTGNPFTRYKNLIVTEKHCTFTETETHSRIKI
uniref:T-cell receptor alpha/delta variable 14.0 n=1 Tax=Scleropages formosus TaxID=113540 RepID=A0A8C9T511_SCLFO